jgi:hypothetical protein
MCKYSLILANTDGAKVAILPTGDDLDREAMIRTKGVTNLFRTEPGTRRLN